MHPLAARPARLFAYLIAWLAIGVLLAPAFAREGGRSFPQAAAFAVPLAGIFGLICLSAWWVCRSHPVTSMSPPRVALAQLGSAALAGLVWGVLGVIWALVLGRLPGATAGLGLAGGAGLTAGNGGAFGSQALRDGARLVVLGAPLYLLSALVHYLFAAVAASHDADRRALGSQVHAREAELRALRAQLNPHFLFNSLNSINALVGGDPEGARRMCERLGDFLRLTLRLGGRESVTLAEELDLVERYLAIEQVRFGDRLRVERRIAPEARSCLLPPLLLQPLVENAIKHGVTDRVEGGTVRLEADRHDGWLLIRLENPVDDDAPERPGTGTGLENVRRRLEVLGGRDASLSAEADAGVFRVVLQLGAREEPRAERDHG